MKLNPDCIRDILLTIESESEYNKGVTFEPKKSDLDLLSKYSATELFYHLRQCNESSFFYDASWYLNGGCYIRDLSPYGHQFLADIRSDSTWNKTKDIAKKVGSNSLDSLRQIAVGVISELVKNQFR